MSLSFLSKKSFHVTNVRNVEKVWLAEQQEAEEQRKLEEWRKAREEERQKMELRELQEETGHAYARLPTTHGPMLACQHTYGRKLTLSGGLPQISLSQPSRHLDTHLHAPLEDLSPFVASANNCPCYPVAGWMCHRFRPRHSCRKKASERVDFLYEQPMTSASEYLLGKAVEVKPEESEVKRVEHLPGSTFLSGQVQHTANGVVFPQLPTGGHCTERCSSPAVVPLPSPRLIPHVAQNNLSSAANEEFNKMTNDPLVLMRMKEQEALKRILDNPLKLK